MRKITSSVETLWSGAEVVITSRQSLTTYTDLSAAINDIPSNQDKHIKQHQGNQDIIKSKLKICKVVHNVCRDFTLLPDVFLLSLNNNTESVFR